MQIRKPRHSSTETMQTNLQQKKNALRKALFFVAGILGILLLVPAIRENAALAESFLRTGPDIPHMLIAVSLCLTNQVTTMLRWMLMARAAGIAVSVRDSFSLGVAGEAGNLFMPVGSGGDAVKIAMAAGTGHSAGRCFAATLADRTVGLMGLATVALTASGTGWLTGHHQTQTFFCLLCGFLVAMSACITVALHPQWWLVLFRHVGSEWKVVRLLLQLSAPFAELRRHLSTLLFAFALSIACNFSTLLILHFSGMAISRTQAPPLLTTLVAGPLALASTTLPLPFGALGVAEQIGQYTFSTLGSDGGALMLLGYRFCVLISVHVLLFVAAILRLRRTKTVSRLTERLSE